MKSGKYKILLVEDTKIAQAMVIRVLCKVNCDVDVANTGTEAINYFKQNIYDMVLMDLGLSDMDGFSAVENIRAFERNNCRARPTPIIALTAHEGDHIETTCLDHEMNDILIKPLTEEKAKGILEKYVSQ